MTAAASDPTRPEPSDQRRDGRAPRADAQRNRDRLVAVARTVFAAQDAVTLEGIAREAGVGIGTLYRHFPTREDLVEAVYAAELDEVTGAVAGLVRDLPPGAALRAWMGRYAAFVATKRGMLDTLRAAWASGRLATPSTRERITEAVATLLAHGASAGALRGDVAADDVVVLLIGVLMAQPGDAPTDQTERLLDLIFDALRPGALRSDAAVTTSG